MGYQSVNSGLFILSPCLQQMYPEYLTIICYMCVQNLVQYCSQKSTLNSHVQCTVLPVRFLHVSPDWIKIQFTKINSCLCYMSIHVPVFTINLTFSPLDVALKLAVDSFIPQPLPIPSHPSTLNSFCTGMSSSLWYWFYLPFLHNKQFYGFFL